MAAISQSLEDQVKCPICLEQYQDPRILPCLHTYCRKCLEGLVDRNGRMFFIKCPECRKTFEIDNVNSLRVNIWVNKNIELLEIDKDLRLMTLEEIEKKVVPPMEKRKLCDKHKGKKQKLFCKLCEILICKDCSLIDHKYHEYVFLAGKLQEKMQDICGTKKKIESALNTVKNMKEKVKKNEQIVKKEIDEKINTKIAILEEMRKKLKQESTNLTAKNMNKLSLRQDGLEMQFACLASAVEFTENILTKGSDHDVWSMKKQIESRLSELSNNEIDVEVDGKYEQILQVYETLNCHDEMMNYLVIKDRFAPDREKSTVGWIEATHVIRLQVRNHLGEPINIEKTGFGYMVPFTILGIALKEWVKKVNF